jgi:subtilisin family serine protease
MNKNVLKRSGIIVMVLAALMLVISWGSNAYADNATMTENRSSATIQDGLRETIQTEGSGSYLVTLREQADLSAAYDITDWEERGWYVYNTLREVADNSQTDILDILKSSGDVVSYQPYFIVNAIHVTSGVATLDAVAVHPAVERIDAENVFTIPEPEISNGVLAPEWGVEIIRATEVWDNLNVFGAGVVLATIDTGVQYNHPALEDKYRGTATGSHDFNFFDPANVCAGGVCDNNGHGTHVTGSMLGDDGGANQIGVAPEAQWIAAKGCESNSCSEASLLASAEWLLAPCEFGDAPGAPSCDPGMRPHVINNSWGGGGGNPWYQTSVDAWRAAAIIPVFSAGNSGPGSGTIGSPSDYCNVMSIGGTNSTDGMYPSSSRGPGAFPGCTDKPDISAPGQGVRSSVPTNSYATFSGTSMASPHVSGCIALMLSVAPMLDYDQVYDILTTTAEDLGAPGFDYDYGHGRIDCYEAVLEAQVLAGPTGTLEGEVTADASGDPLAGALIEATLNVTTTRTALTDASGQYVMTFVPEGTYDVTASLFGYLPQTVSGIDVISGTVTTQNFSLELAPSHTVSGIVTDANTGWPLYASIEVDGADISTVWTDPVDGSYSILLPEGITYTLHVDAWVAGYEGESRDVGPLTGDVTEDFGLDVDTASCMAPGYSLSYLYFEDFQADDGGYTLAQTGTNPAPWQWGEPVTWPSECPAGTNCWGTNLTGNYNNSTGEILTSPVIDLSGVAPGEQLTARWYQANHIEHHGWDQAFAEVSIDGGAWQVMWQNPPSPTVQEPWRELSYDISAAAGSDVQFRWRFNTDSSVNFAGWYIDRIAIAAGAACEPAEGGLVVGNVYDGNTGDALVGAIVSSDDDTMITAATPADPNVDDGFYTVFAAAGSNDVMASMAGGYADETVTLNITDGTTTGQDFNLAAGWLVPDPVAFDLAVELGDSDTALLTLNNNGDAALDYTLLVASLSEDFEGTFPPAGWEVINNGGACVWQRNDAWPRDNYAGGDGFSAAADSDLCGQGTTMNSELHTPVLNLSGATVASLDFVASYRHLGSSSFQVHISDDGGATWNTELTWNASVDPTGPGAPVSIDLAPYIGSNNVIISFHYTAPSWDWWAQVDQVRVLSDAGPWLSLDPAAGTIDANDSELVDLNISTVTLPEPGVYHATISVNEDTPYDAPSIPVTLTVTASPDLALLEGTVQSMGYCDENPFAAAGAQVEVTSGPDSWTVTADANGYYYLYLNESYSPVDIEVTAPDHESGSATGVVLVGQQTTTVDFDLRLLEPCASVNPDAYDIELLVDSVATYTLNINNDGGGDLIWNIDEAEAAADPGTAAIGPMPQAIPGNATNAADLVSQLGAALPFNSGPATAVGGVVDCDGEPGIIIHDDGSVENGYSGNPAVVSEVIFVDRFTPDSYPANFWAVCVAFISQGPTSLNFNIVLYADDGPGGAPGTQLGSMAATATGMPGGVGAPVWHSYDISSLGISVTSGDVYIGVSWAPSSPNVFVSSDQSTTNPPGFAGGYWWNDNAGVWATIQSAFPDYRSLMVRAVQAQTGCNSPTDLPWVSVTPDSGTTGADSSDQVSVTFDTTGLTAGMTYTGTLCFNSNDPMMSLIEIPLSLTVDDMPDASIDLDVTVGTEADVCGVDDTLEVTPGTVVYYCYTVTNTGNVMLPNHTITDTVFGHIDTFVYDLVPGETESVIYPKTIMAASTSTARWTAENVGMGMSAMAEDTVTVTVSMYYLYLPYIAAP